MSLWERVPPRLCTGSSGAGHIRVFTDYGPVLLCPAPSTAVLSGTEISKFSLISGFEVSVPGYCRSQAFSSPSPLSQLLLVHLPLSTRMLLTTLSLSYPVLFSLHLWVYAFYYISRIIPRVEFGKNLPSFTESSAFSMTLVNER